MLNKEAGQRLVRRGVGGGGQRGTERSQGAERVIEWDREEGRRGAVRGGERERRRDSSRWTAAQPATHSQKDRLHV